MKKVLCKLIFVCFITMICLGFSVSVRAEDVTQSKEYTGTITEMQTIYGSNDPENPLVITINGTVSITDNSFDTFSVKNGYVKFVGKDETSKLVVSDALENPCNNIIFVWTTAHVEIEHLEIGGRYLMWDVNIHGGEMVIKEGTVLKESAGACVTVGSATLWIEGGSFYLEQGNLYSACIIAGTGKIYMSGGNIQGKTGNGVAIAVGTSETTLTGGTISGFPIGVDKYLSGGQLVIGDELEFSNNEVDIHIRPSGTLFTIRDDFKGSAGVAVSDTETLADGAKRQITTPDTAEKMKKQITSAMEGYSVGYENGYLYLSETVHEHDWFYEAKEHQIFASCISQIKDCEYKNKQYVLTLTADDMEYTGAAYDKVSVENGISEITGDEVGEVMYYQVTGGKETKLSVPPTEPGDYIAAVTVADATAKAAFSITKEPETIPEEEIEVNTFKINAGLKVSQTGKKITVKWGEVSRADGYKIYLQYCGKKFGKPVKVIKNAKKTTASFKKVNGKKIDLKQNFKVYVVAYKVSGGKELVLGKSITGHVVGRKNKECSNAKSIKVAKSKVELKVGKSAKIKAKTILVDKSKRQLNNKHAKEFRFASDNKKVAKVSAKGKITAVGKGTCNVYVYARNGFAQKIEVTVK